MLLASLPSLKRLHREEQGSPSSERIYEATFQYVFQWSHYTENWPRRSGKRASAPRQLSTHACAHVEFPSSAITLRFSAPGIPEMLRPPGASKATRRPHGGLRLRPRRDEVPETGAFERRQPRRQHTHRLDSLHPPTHSASSSSPSSSFSVPCTVRRP